MNYQKVKSSAWFAVCVVMSIVIIMATIIGLGSVIAYFTGNGEIGLLGSVSFVIFGASFLFSYKM